MLDGYAKHPDTVGRETPPGVAPELPERDAGHARGLDADHGHRFNTEFTRAFITRMEEMP